MEAHIVSSFGKYRLIASLARGGMARVYLALMAGPADFHKLLVLKVMRGSALGDSADAVRMFMNEARLAARIDHPNVVHTYEVGEFEGRPFLAMEYVEGQTYRTLQTRAGGERLPLEEELRILAELARGLHGLHELVNFDGEPLQAVHRDVSPQNVLVGYDGKVKLLDFGIAKTCDASHWTQAGVIKGKIDYIAPEQLRGESVDRRADVYALGVMLWEAIAGKRYAGGSSVAEVAKAQARLSGTEPNIRQVDPDVPEPLALLLDRALALLPEDRLSDAASFAEALDAYLQSSGARPTAKSLGAIVSSLFADDRAKLRKVVEAQIEAVRQQNFERADATGALPRLELRGTRTESSVWALAAQSKETSLLAPWSPQSSPPTQRPRGKLRPRSWGVIGAAAITAAAAAWFTPSSEAGPEVVEKPATAPLDATGATAVTPPSAPPAAAANEQESEPSLASVHIAGPEAPGEDAPATMHLTLSVVPASARVTLDGVSVTLPFAGTLPRDGALHDLRASAPGYQPYRQLVGFDRDRDLEITLQRVAARRPASKPSKTRPTDLYPVPLALDTDDPYGVGKTK